MKALIECERPSVNLYSFVGNMTVYSESGSSDSDVSGLTFPLYLDNLLLRGSRLKDTEYIYGTYTIFFASNQLYRADGSAVAAPIIIAMTIIILTLGCAVYTGHDTKLALNSILKSNKFSTVEKYVSVF